jgi:hypothetical protein
VQPALPELLDLLEQLELAPVALPELLDLLEQPDLLVSTEPPALPELLDLLEQPEQVLQAQVVPPEQAAQLEPPVQADYRVPQE